MPWETHDNIKKRPKGYVKWYEWAYRPEGFKQVGCIYTAQGFEFDYVGVIIGDDLIFDEGSNRLVGNIEKTKDPTLRKNKENFELHVKISTGHFSRAECAVVTSILQTSKQKTFP